jgi:hypothetical protein
VDVQQSGDERVAVALQDVDHNPASIDHAPSGAQSRGHILDDVRRGQHGPFFSITVSTLIASGWADHGTCDSTAETEGRRAPYRGDVVDVTDTDGEGAGGEAFGSG